ncbi:MAG: hypothetical protein GF346_00950 [Candidatus Eisenbacteria bacterium]|nr:hypothetical protein [Candidatus Latescibacterota bacterium]MBD3301000.1 hypothetical protein [Candidatus Eisenbacteria bacterium]
MKRRWILLPAACGLAGCFLFLGCGDDHAKPEIEEPADYPSATTIDRLLENFQQAYKERNAGEFERLLHEDFTFVFDPRDVGPDTWPEPTWGREEEIEATGNLLGGEPNREDLVVERVRLEWTAGEPHGSPDDEKWRRVILAPVDLEIETVDANNGDRVFLVTPGGYETHLHVLETEEIDPSTGEPIWKLVKWEDKPPVKKAGRSPRTEQFTWGMIKSLYR